MWSDEKWQRFQVFLEKLTLKPERKRERRTLAKSSSSSFSGFSSSSYIPVLFSHMTTEGSRVSHQISAGSSCEIDVIIFTVVTLSVVTPVLLPRQL